MAKRDPRDAYGRSPSEKAADDYLGGISRKKQIAIDKNKTTPSGKVAAAQRAQAASDTPLKNTTQKKPSSGKNEPSPTVQKVEQRYNSRGDARFHLIDNRGVVARNPDGSRMRSYKTQAEADRALAKQTTPSGAVADKQRKQAVKDSPIKAQTTKAPKSKKNSINSAQEKAIKAFAGSPLGQAAFNDAQAAVEKRFPNLAKSKVQSYNPKTGPTTAQKKANAAAMGKNPAKVKSSRKLSMDPKQVARRAKRGFPSGR